MLALGIKLVQKCQQDLCYLNNLSKNKILILIGQMSSFKFLFFGWLFASQKTGFSGFRYRFIPSLRFGTGYASPYNPCHCLKLKNSKLNLINILGIKKTSFELQYRPGQTHYKQKSVFLAPSHGCVIQNRAIMRYTLFVV